MTKPATITLTIELNDVLDVTATAPEGGSARDRDLIQRLATGVRALVLTDESTVLKAEKIYTLANADTGRSDISTTEISRIQRDIDLERLMTATHDPADPFH